jgi:hypothetical protein
LWLTCRSCGLALLAAQLCVMVHEMRRLIILFGVVLTLLRPAFGQQVTEFKSVEAFLHSLNNAEVRGEAKGDIFGRSNMDWVGIVVSGEQDTKTAVIYILEKLNSGSYRPAGKSAPRDAFGGTGNYYYEDISIENRSVFSTLSYHWHSCAGNSTSQFSVTKNDLQLVGIESFETNSVDGTGIDLNTSINFLTSKAIFKTTNKGKVKVARKKVVPKVILLQDYNGDGTISMQHSPIC